MSTANAEKLRCRCADLPTDGPDRTDHEDELLVVDEITSVVHRCKLCGRKVRVRYIPGDYVASNDAGGVPISRGVRGSPILSRAR